MNLGTQLHAPDGFENLSKGVRYYYLFTDDESGLTTLTTFSDQSSGRRVQIHRLPNDKFWSAVESGRIAKHPDPVSLPQWLSRLEGRNVESEDEQRLNAKQLHNERAQQRYSYIESLVPRLEDILRAANPFTLLNRHAKSIKPLQNRQRIAEWFFAYICHGMQVAALWPEFKNVGTYDKAAEKYATTHFGRVSADKGRLTGWPSGKFTETIIEAVDHFLGQEMTKHQIYIESLKKFFGCRGRENDRGDWEPYHPKGKPFPETEGKFWYQWYKHCDLAKTNLRHYGEHHVRAQSGSKGSYAQCVPAILSEIEVDGYYLKERPLLFNGEGYGDPLCVVRGVCVGTKNVVGVGFANGSEDGDAYRMMLFCAAIGLDEFALLWGLEPESLLKVVVRGLPSHIVSDRGAAPVASIIANLQEKFPVREMAQTHSGQSKPNVESGHPRTKKVERPASYVVSDKNVIQLIKREICRGAKDNHVRDIRSLIAGQRALDRVAYSPVALAEYLERKGLNDGIQVTYATAVRRFLWPADFELRDGGFWLGSKCFSCAKLDDSDLYTSLSAGQGIVVPGYHLKLNLLWAWVEFRGQLYKLKQKLSFTTGEQERMTNVADIPREVEIKAELAAEHTRSAAAADIEATSRFEESVGVPWGGAERKPGRARKTPDAALEKKVLGRKYPGSRSKRKAA